MIDTPEQAEARERHHRHIVAPALIRTERVRADELRRAADVLYAELPIEAFDIIGGRETLNRLYAAADEHDRDADALEESIRRS